MWFNGRDIAHVLEYKFLKHTLQQSVLDDDKIHLRDINTDVKLNLHPSTIYLSEYGLYNLIVQSRKKSALHFKKWITQKVLPSIRKYGLKKHEIELYDIMKNKIGSMKNKYPTQLKSITIKFSD